MDEKNTNMHIASLIKSFYGRNCGIYPWEMYEEMFHLFDDDKNFEFFISYKGSVKIDTIAPDKYLSVIKILNRNTCLIMYEKDLTILKAIEKIALENNYDGILIESLNYESIQSVLRLKGYIKTDIPTESKNLFLFYYKSLKKS